MKLFRSKRICILKPVFSLFLFALLLSACPGSEGGGSPPLTLATLEGSASIPIGGGAPKPGVSKKILPGATEFKGATVTVRDLSTGVILPNAAVIGDNGLFRIENVPVGKDYLVAARKGTILLLKIVSVPTSPQNPLINVGEVDAASTAAVLALEAFINESLPTPIELREDLPPGTDPDQLSDLIESGDADATESRIRNIINLVVNASGDVNVNIDVNIFNDSQGIPDADRIAITNIYLAVYNVLREGDQTADESNPDVLSDWEVDGQVAGNSVLTTIIVNHLGTVTINISVTAEPADLNDNLAVITKPETTINSGPSNPTQDDFATFNFTSNRPNSTFQCALDGVAASACTSPVNFTGLAMGSHTFSVVATGPDGEVDPSPALHTWQVGFVQNFENGKLDGWVPSGRQITGGFGSGSWGVSDHAGSQMAFLTHISFTELRLSKTFEYTSGDTLQFDAEFSINGDTSPSASGGSNFYDEVGYRLTLFNSNGDQLGTVVNIAATTTFPYNPNEGRVEFRPNGLQHYSHDISQFASDLGVDINNVATFSLTFHGYSSWFSGDNMTVRFDNVSGVANPTANSVLTVVVAGSGSGVVTATGINCPGDCGEAYPEGTVVPLTATPAADSVFVGWSEDPDCTDASVTMTVNKNCTATFDLKPPVNFTLNVTIDPAGTGGGTVTSSPAGIGCGVDCTQDYADGTGVTLTAAPDAGSAFAGWTGSGCSGVGTCAVTMDIAKTVTAKFDVVVPEPDTVIDGKPSNPDVLSSALFTFHATVNGVNETGATFECKLDSGTWGACTSPKTYPGLTDGVHTFMVRATSGGKTDQTPASWTWTISAPPDTFIDDGPPNPTNSTNATFMFSSNKAGATFECDLDGDGVTTFLPCVSSKTYDPVALGAHVFKVRAIDPATGIKDPTPATHNWTVGPCTTIFCEDFEAGIGFWAADNGVWNVGTPTAGPAACDGGVQCAGTELSGNYGAFTDSRLISPRIVLPAVSGIDEVHLRFQHWFSYSTGDSGQVQVQIFDPTAGTWGAWVNEGTSVVNTSSWSLKDVDLTAYADKIIRIAFFHAASRPFGGSDESTGWYIDNVTIVKKAPTFSGDFEGGWGDWGADRGVWGAGTPTAGPTSCLSGTQCAGTELAGNYGAHTDSRLISPRIVLPAVSGIDEVHLRFQHWFSYSTGDSGQVQVQIFDPTAGTWGAWVNEGTSVVNTSSWSLKDVDLTAYADKIIRIAFFHAASRPFGGSDESTGWYIDDVAIVKF